MKRSFQINKNPANFPCLLGQNAGKIISLVGLTFPYITIFMFKIKH